ncbi:MAG: exonuclease subunit SbcD [Anaerolineae bacterium]|nr:exonuclease subunit SbcD [Anaerolineae bacterium]
MLFCQRPRFNSSTRARNPRIERRTVRDAVRILHTSDWHLGLSTGCVSRLPEQQRFLAWLAALLAEQAVDALVVAGDVFDSMQPSAEAQEAYYRFLAGLAATGVRDVVVVGGNHDSPSRLDAPREVLAALGVHVVGGLAAPEEPLDMAVVPLRRRGSETVEAVCLAVPYVHEYRLGVRTTDLDRGAVAEAFRVRFTELYSRLVDRAQALYSGLPVIATGHMVLGEVRREDYTAEIHQVGFIKGLPASVLDPRLAYTALGHIHRAYPVEEGHAWYSGSPLPVSVADCTVARNVLLVELPEAGPPAIAPIRVPVFRELRVIEGSPVDLVRDLKALTSSAPLPPLVHVRACLDGPEPRLRETITAALDAHAEPKRPVLIGVQEVFVGATEDVDPVPQAGLDEMTEAEVFARLCQATRTTDAEELQRAFATLLSWPEEELERAIEQARTGVEGTA